MKRIKTLDSFYQRARSSLSNGLAENLNPTTTIVKAEAVDPVDDLNTPNLNTAATEPVEVQQARIVTTAFEREGSRCTCPDL